MPDRDGQVAGRGGARQGGTGAQGAKDQAAAVVHRHLSDLVALSHAVHATPELCFNETRSAKAVADALRAGGLAVTEGVYDLPTAFESRSGGGELVVAVCAEYDAPRKQGRINRPLAPEGESLY